MSSATFRLVLLVSCAHALVHVFELSLPAVEQLIGAEYGVGTRQTGMLGTAWRLPFGCGALLAGWLADRYGSKPLLVVYLWGCALAAVGAWWVPSLGLVFAAMFAMGCFASIYHPAGLALISRATTPENRGAALGWHGILGSVGIAAAPFLAGVVFAVGSVTWRQYYLLLAVPAAVLALLLIGSLREQRPSPHRAHGLSPASPGGETVRDTMQWRLYFVLVVSGAMSGFVYAAFMHFLPRYLDGAGLRPSGLDAASFRNALAALVLTFGIAGQAFAGRIARPGRLEAQLAIVLLADVPLLVWMAVAEGGMRLAAACGLALVFFMNQPLYNSLIAQYVPAARRSTAYGFSNMVGFGFGALGPAYAGFVQSDRWTYGSLALFAALASLLMVPLIRAVRPMVVPEV